MPYKTMAAKSSSNWIRVTGSSGSFTFFFASRDWKLLSDMEGEIGRQWMKAFGFSPGGPEFSVGRGLQIGYEVTGTRSIMLRTTELLISRLTQEADLLSYDYVVTIRHPGGERDDTMYGGGMSGFQYDGKYFALQLYPGQCLLEETTLAATGLRFDLRAQKMFVLDGGITLKIGRRKRGFAWLDVLPQVLDFLNAETSTTITIYNHHHR
jgi:hypothetical protein